MSYNNSTSYTFLERDLGQCLRLLPSACINPTWIYIMIYNPHSLSPNINRQNFTKYGHKEKKSYQERQYVKDLATWCTTKVFQSNNELCWKTKERLREKLLDVDKNGYDRVTLQNCYQPTNEIYESTWNATKWILMIEVNIQIQIEI